MAPLPARLTVCCWTTLILMLRFCGSAIRSAGFPGFITMFACIHVPDARAAAAAQSALLDFASAFSPRVEDTAVGTVVLDIEGLDCLFGSTAELGQRLHECASSLGTMIQVGMASNPDAAICAARAWAGITILDRK